MNARILIFEDQEGAALEAVGQLMTLGFVVVRASDLETAVKYAQDLKPDVVLLNITVSVDGGFSLAERLRLSFPTAETPLIVGLPNAMNNKREKIISLPKITCINHPYDSKVLMHEIQQISRQNRTTPKIVVVDDDPVLLKLLQTRLKAQGYDVVSVLESDEAINRIYKEDPDLLIIDIVMPEPSGWRITQELKTSPEYKNLPIIFLSALIEKEGAAKSHEIGDYFMAKPVLMDKLIAKIKEILKHSHA